MRRRACLIFVSLAALTAFSAAFSVAEARTQDGIKLLGKTVPVVVKKYPGLTPSPRQGTATVNIVNCSTPVTFCDTIRLDADVQETLFLYSLRVTLSWPNPKTKDNPAGTDLTLAIWEQEDDPTTGRVVWTGANAEVHPEIAEFGQDAQEPQTFFIVVNGEPRGPAPNSEYTIRAEFAPIDLGALPEGAFRSRGGGGALSASASGSRANKGSGGAFGEEPSGDSENLEPVKLPGADGDPVAQELPLYLRGDRAKEGGVAPAIPIAIAILMLGGAGGFFRLRTRRKPAEL